MRGAGYWTTVAHLRNVGKPAALVVGESLVGLREARRRPVVGPVRDGNLDEPWQDRVSARADRREVAVAETRNLDHGDSTVRAFLRLH